MAPYAFDKLAAANQNCVLPGTGTDPFTEIYRLKNAARFTDALEKIYDCRRDCICAPFDQDVNHAWYVIADIHCRQGQFDFAKRAFERALIEWPDDVDALIGLANACFELDMHELSLRTLMVAKKVNPFDERVWYNLANAHLDCEDYEDAVAIYERLISTGSTLSILARKNMTVALERMEQD